MRILTILLLPLLLFCVTSEDTGPVRKGPYLLYEGSNTSMGVLWQLDTTQACIIRWGPTPACSAGSASVQPYGDLQYRYDIAGLTPGTHYYYEIEGVGSGSFRTAPADDASRVKILAYGDTRSNPGDHDAVAAQMVRTLTADPAFQTIAIHAGDWSGDGDNEDDWDNEVFARDRDNLLEFYAGVPVTGPRGNHEGSGALFRKYFDFPYERDFYWSYDYGPVHVAVVDQYVDYSPGSAQYEWLRNDLASSTKPWKIVTLHEPGWSAGGGHSNESAVQDHIQPLCTQYGVQFVIGGHNHFYARAEVEEVQHITTGGGGAPLRGPERAPYVVGRDKSLHFCEMDFDGDTCRVTVRRSNGSVVEMLEVSREADGAGMLSAASAGRATPQQERTTVARP